MRVREKLADLMRHLRILEFDDNMRHWVKFFIENDHKSFTLPYWKQFGADTVKYRLHFQKDEKQDRYRVEKYEATLKKDLPILEQVIAGLNTKKLEARMQKVDWTADHAGLDEIGFGTDTEESRIQAALLPSIMSDLQKLGDASPGGEELQAAFMYKYWYDTPFEIKTPQTEALKAAQEFSTTITSNLQHHRFRSLHAAKRKSITNFKSYNHEQRQFEISLRQH